MATKKEIINNIHSQLLPYKEKLSEIYGGYSLALAMCYIESGGNKWSFNYEPGFQKVYIQPLNINPEAQFEIVFRATSFGLFQVMGQILREQGVKSKMFPGRDIQSEEYMNDVEMQVNSYIKHINKFYLRYYSPVKNNQNLIWDIVASYNAGGVRKTLFGQYQNQVYVDKVAEMKKYIEENMKEIL